MALPSHSEPLRWQKIRKVVNRAKFDFPSHTEPLWWEKIGKVPNWAKLAIPSHSEQFWWGQDWKSWKSGEIGPSESF